MTLPTPLPRSPSRCHHIVTLATLLPTHAMIFATVYHSYLLKDAELSVAHFTC